VVVGAAVTGLPTGADIAVAGENSDVSACTSAAGVPADAGTTEPAVAGE
jgi:hypothetical protein